MSYTFIQMVLRTRKSVLELAYTSQTLEYLFLKRTSDQLSVDTAEMLAVIIGLQWVEEVRPDRVVICIDSFSILQSIQSTTTAREDILIELNHSLLRLHRGGIDLQFCWCLHMGG